jgi:hypothetical protein
MNGSLERAHTGTVEKNGESFIQSHLLDAPQNHPDSDNGEPLETLPIWHMGEISNSPLGRVCAYHTLNSTQRIIQLYPIFHRAGPRTEPCETTHIIQRLIDIVQ